MSHLAFRYQYDGSPSLVLDDFGRLEMKVITESRSGQGGFWVQWQDVKEFGETLSTFPIDDHKPINAEWGYTENGVYERVLSVTIAPAEARGALRVRVEIADEHDPSDHVRASFRTSYAALAAFQTEVARLMAGEIEQAVLKGE